MTENADKSSSNVVIPSALIEHLKGLSTKRFLKVEPHGKGAVEKDWPNHLYEPKNSKATRATMESAQAKDWF